MKEIFLVPAPAPKEEKKRNAGARLLPRVSQSDSTAFLDRVQALLEKYGHHVDARRKGASVLRIVNSLLDGVQGHDSPKKEPWDEFVGVVLEEEEERSEGQ
jgi:intein/homing endonuclease